MNCDRVRQLLSAYIDQRLRYRDWVRVREHLASCDACRAELAQYEARIQVLKSMPNDDPGPRFNEDVLAKFAMRSQRTSIRLKVALAFAMAMALVVLAIPIYVVNLEHFIGRQDIYVIGRESLIPGSRASVRVVVANRGAQNPVDNAYVTLAISGRSGRFALLSGRTNSAGTLDGSFIVPANLTGDYQLTATSSSSLGTDRLSIPITLKRKAKVLVTTDKPVYQPGQIIHVRALALLRPSMKPASSDKIRFVIEDPRQNKVCDESFDTSKWGVASIDFELGDEINLGTYTVKATLGETETKKTVTVKRYVLPKFKVTLDTDGTFYLPGQMIRGTVSARYFFGKPAANALVRVNLSALEARFSRFAQIQGRTNSEGVFTFESKVPGFVVGQPSEGGAGMLKIATTVKDTAEHSEEIVRTMPVAKSPVRIAVVPESGELAPGLENIVYVVTSYPDGRPAPADTSLVLNGGTMRARSDALGVSVFTLTPSEGDTKISVSARTSAGFEVNESFSFPARTDPAKDEYYEYALERAGLSSPKDMGQILIRSDKAVYEAGDTAQLVILSTKKTGSVYVDAVLDGQTVLTGTAHLKHGRAEVALDLSNDYAGILTFSAYTMSPIGVPVRDTATVLVRSAKALTVKASPDRPSYRPGDRARIDFDVSDRSGKPVAAAVGVNIVDESVFSVEEQMPGLAALYFALQDEILKPRYQIKADFDNEGYRERLYRDPEGAARQMQQDMLIPRSQIQGGMPDWNDPNALLADERAASIQRAAKVLFAEAGLPDSDTIDAVTQAQKDEVVHKVQHGFGDAGLGLIVFYAIVMIIVAVAAYVKRRWVAMVTAAAGLANILILALLIVMQGFSSSNLSSTDFVPIGVLIAVGLWFAALSASVRGSQAGETFVNVLAVFMITGLLAAILFPVFARAREAARRSTMMSGLWGCARALQPQSADANVPVTGTKPVRVRQFFPETLYSNPAVITGDDGRASITVPVADSITSWRISALASSMNGEIGTVNAPMKVFQEFFVDLDLPVGVTQGDAISVPVAIYNYLPRAQSISLTLKGGSWFEPKSESVKTRQLGPNEVSVIYFPIRATKLGRHALAVEARSPSMADAIRREITVYPNGQEQSKVVNGMLSGSDTATVEIPRYAIRGASKLLVKVYPGAFSQVVDGLDALLQVPYGCFEQTSSITYPNVLILKYLQQTKQDKPRISMKAEQYISLGYQRLLTFEVAGGGFDWFGDPPANTVLTAYGVMELSDMASVATVDRNLIKRAVSLLERRQHSDGSWNEPVSTHTWTSLDSSLPITAYVTWALAEGGRADSGAVKRGCAYLTSHVGSVRDPYTLALIANALVAADDDSAREALDRLADMAVVRKDRATWPASSETLTYGSGRISELETTALAAYAFLKSHTHPDRATQALKQIIATKDSLGSWDTTQATILSLKALFAGASTSLGGAAQIRLTVNGSQSETIELSGSDTDVVRTVDVSRLIKPGRNTVKMTVGGDGGPAYQVLAKYYVPWSRAARPTAERMHIDVSYGKLRVGKDGVIDARATVKAVGAPVKMAIVDLGVPPGFALSSDDLDALKSKRVIDRYEITPRQVILYLKDIRPGRPIQIGYRLRALYPVRVVVPASQVYDYYNPDATRATARPVIIEAI